MNVIKVQIKKDGTIKVDARGMEGSTAEITKSLESLAAEIGGDLVIEKHEPGRHAYHTHDEKGHIHE